MMLFGNDEPQPVRPKAVPAAAQVECAITEAELARMASEWEELARRDPYAHVFQTHVWMSSWLRHQATARPRVWVARREQRITAAIPLAREKAGPGPGVLRIAADGESDFCQALSDPEYPEDLETLWDALLARTDWHLLDLRYLPEKSPLGALAAHSRRGLLVARQPQEIAPYLDMTADWRQTVPKSQRPKLERRRRQLHEAGDVTFEVAATPAQVQAMLAELAELHISRWRDRGETSIFLFPERRAFLQDACAGLLASGSLYLCRLAVSGRPVALGLYYLWRRRLLNSIYTFSEEFRRLGPVHLLVLHAIEDARARNLADVHDFGRGAEEYKLRWTDQSARQERVLVARRSPLGSPAFWWAAHVKPWVWAHPQLGTALREARRRLALRGANG